MAQNWLDPQRHPAAAIQRDTAAEVRRMLDKANADIAKALKASPSDYQKFRLTELQREVKRAMAELEPAAGVPVERAGSTLDEPVG